MFSLLKMHSSVFGDQARLWVLHVASRCPLSLPPAAFAKPSVVLEFFSKYPHSPLCVFQVLYASPSHVWQQSEIWEHSFPSRVSLKACNSTIRRYRKSALILASRSCIQFFRLSNDLSEVLFLLSPTRGLSSIHLLVLFSSYNVSI